jgi:hypothetical protein
MRLEYFDGLKDNNDRTHIASDLSHFLLGVIG